MNTYNISNNRDVTINERCTINPHLTNGEETARLKFAIAATSNDMDGLAAGVKSCGVDCMDAWGNTALSFAVMNMDKEAVKYLIRQGADPYITSTDGTRSPMVMAEAMKLTDIIRIMTEGNRNG